MRPFSALLAHPHLTTLAGNFWPRPVDARFPSRDVYYTTDAGTQIRVEETRPLDAPRGEVLLVHGLEGSSRSGYMISMALELARAGYVAHRMNLRSCGGTEHLSPTLYHSGLTVDARRILEQLRAAGRGPLYIVGYSLGGNVTLKLAGELGAERSELVRAACAVSVPVDLHECVRAIGRRENWIYEQRFVGRLKQRYARRHAVDPEHFPVEGLERVRTIYEFDDFATARAFGFGDAPNYYRTQSSLQFVPSIGVPTLIVQAQDDPMIPFPLFHKDEIRGNARVELVAPRHGGHLGFIARQQPRFWADATLVEWISRH